jgi:hypothetical protein
VKSMCFMVNHCLLQSDRFCYSGAFIEANVRFYIGIDFATLVLRGN